MAIRNYYTHPPASGHPPKQGVIFLHGYGSNGQDLISLAPYFQSLLPEAVFLSPDAPFPCEMGGGGYQWFSLSDYTPQKLLEGAQIAHPILDDYIAKTLKDYHLTADKVALVGFSQGTMMALYSGLRHDPPIAAVLGYSGALIGAETIPQGNNKSSVMLVHGESDSVVPVDASREAHTIFQQQGYKISLHTRAGLGHSIDEKGIDLGCQFLMDILL